MTNIFDELKKELQKNYKEWLPIAEPRENKNLSLKYGKNGVFAYVDKENGGLIKVNKIPKKYEHLNWELKPSQETKSLDSKKDKKNWGNILSLENDTSNINLYLDLLEHACKEINPDYQIKSEIVENIEVNEGKENKDMNKDDKNKIYPKNQILYGPPGTGKTYNSISYAVAIIDGTTVKEDENRDVIEEKFKKYKDKGQIDFVTFHQSFSYEDFIEGIKAYSPDDKNIIYEVRSGIFKLICKRASDALKSYNKIPNFDNFKGTLEKLLNEVDQSENEKLEIPMIKGSFYLLKPIDGNTIHFENQKGNSNNSLSISTLEKIYLGEREFKTGLGVYYKNLINYMKQKEKDINTKPTQDEQLRHVIIIDEINRGNIAQIFGELITLIEDDKRDKFSVKLPNYKDGDEEFFVPSNLYILGTMNTADRSIEALDTALRRRFSFVEMFPDSDKLKDKDKEDGIDLDKLLDAVNYRIEKLLNKNYTIGHSYFMNIDKNNLEESLRNIFQNKIIPLLQEYFYGDWGKIGLVLGRDFIEEKPNKSKISFLNFNSYEQDDMELLNSKKIWAFTDSNKWKLDNFINIYKENAK